MSTAEQTSQASQTPTTSAQSALVVQCDHYPCEKQTIYVLGSGRMPYSRCARCRIANYCSKECQCAHWPEHKSACQPYAASEKLADGLAHFTRNYVRLAGSRFFNSITSAMMRARGFDTQRGALCFDFASPDAMDGAIDALCDPNAFLDVPVMFVDAEKLIPMKTTRVEVAEELAVYPLETSYFVYVQVPLPPTSKNQRKRRMRGTAINATPRVYANFYYFKYINE